MIIVVRFVVRGPSPFDKMPLAIVQEIFANLTTVSERRDQSIYLVTFDAYREYLFPFLEQNGFKMVISM